MHASWGSSSPKHGCKKMLILAPSHPGHLVHSRLVLWIDRILLALQVKTYEDGSIQETVSSEMTVASFKPTHNSYFGNLWTQNRRYLYPSPCKSSVEVLRSECENSSSSISISISPPRSAKTFDGEILRNFDRGERRTPWLWKIRCYGRNC